MGLSDPKIYRGEREVIPNAYKNMNREKQTNKKSKKAIIIAVAVLLAVALTGGAIVAAVLLMRQPAVMVCEGERIELSFYEFMLSRVKGELYRDRLDVDSEDFWSSKMPESDMTYEEYYTASVLESCKAYLISLVMYDELVGSGELDSLPQSYYDQIDEDIQLYIDLGYVGDGSEEKFNSILSDYGVDADGLREIYVAEAKVQYLKDYLYGGDDASKISDSVKEEYYEENYYRFKHILVGSFYYKYIVDESGNVMYFEDDDDGKVLYDKENGERHFGDDGNYLRDSYGTEIYFVKGTDPEQRLYAYDTENGVTRFETDPDGQIKRYEYTEAEMAERKKIAESLCAIDKGDFDAFEQKGLDGSVNTDYSGTFGTTDGVYMSDIELSSYSGYMPELLSAVKALEVGEISYVEAEDGYHVIMRYEPDKGAYSDENSEEWFVNFNTSLITKLYLEKCQGRFGEIEMNEKNLGKAHHMKDIGANTDY